MATGKRGKPFPRGAKNPAHRSRRRETGSGRAKGSRNKFTRDVKELILQSIEQLGGVDWLVKLGKGRDKKALAQLLGKLVPAPLAGTGQPTSETIAADVRAKLKQIEDTTTT